VFKLAALPDQAGIESDQRVICRSATGVAIFSPLNRLVDIDRHPFFVFGERRVRLLQIKEFTRSFDERGMFMSSALNSAAFARYCSAENI
jgi:hypothetical protein